MSESAVDLRKYEAVIILHPDLSEEEQKAFFRKNADIVKSFNGQVNHLDTWGTRKLANPIGKFTRGLYFHTTFEADGKAVAELERTMGINEKVLRFFHMRLDDRTPLSQHVEKFKQGLIETLNREKDREAKSQARRAQFAAQREGSHRRQDSSGPMDRFE